MESIPSVLSFLICDMIIIEAGTGKKSIVGVFDTMYAHGEPGWSRIGVYARLTDMEGAYKFTIRLVHLGDQEELIAWVETPENRVDDRLAMVEIALNLPPVRFPKLGRYEFQLFANDIYMGRATLNVVQMEVSK